MRLPERKFVASELIKESESGAEELITADDYLRPNQWSECEPSEKEEKKASLASIIEFDVICIC
jgi:hypothetical protein